MKDLNCWVLISESTQFLTCYLLPATLLLLSLGYTLAILTKCSIPTKLDGKKARRFLANTVDVSTKFISFPFSIIISKTSIGVNCYKVFLQKSVILNE